MLELCWKTIARLHAFISPVIAGVQLSDLQQIIIVTNATNHHGSPLLRSEKRITSTFAVHSFQIRLPSHFSA